MSHSKVAPESFFSLLGPSGCGPRRRELRMESPGLCSPTTATSRFGDEVVNKKPRTAETDSDGRPELRATSRTLNVFDNVVLRIMRYRGVGNHAIAFGQGSKRRLSMVGLNGHEPGGYPYATLAADNSNASP
jgi:ABC-type transporter Mla maintaining outer membrane lipid asymmetry ATPase subunit MlaF